MAPAVGAAPLSKRARTRSASQSWSPRVTSPRLPQVRARAAGRPAARAPRAGPREHQAQARRVPIDVTVQYLASALVGVLTWWLDSGMPHKPEQMERMFLRLTRR
jgi:hypothetical protein